MRMKDKFWVRVTDRVTAKERSKTKVWAVRVYEKWVKAKFRFGLV